MYSELAATIYNEAEEIELGQGAFSGELQEFVRISDSQWEALGGERAKGTCEIGGQVYSWRTLAEEDALLVRYVLKD